MNCHIVPQVYLKSWKIDGTKNSIYIFNNTLPLKKGDIHNISNLRKSSFVGNDLYILNNYSSIYASYINYEFSELFDFMINQGFTGFYSNMEISTLNEFIRNFSHIEEWNIIDSNGLSFNNSDFKKLLDTQWTNYIQAPIEKYFSKSAENYWNNFLKYVNEKICKRSFMVYAENKDYLLEFIAIQFCRVYKNLREFGIDIILDVIVNSSKFPPNAKAELSGQQYKDDLCLMLLYRYVQYKRTCDPLFKDNTITGVINRFKDQMQIIFLISVSRFEFLTSDNPCLHVSLESTFDQHFSGIFLPIMPNVCVFLTKSVTKTTLNKYLIMDVCAQNVKYINYMLLSESMQNVAFHNDSINNIFDRHPDLEDWISNLHKIDLLYVDPNLNI
jgi:hypothetical protein